MTGALISGNKWLRTSKLQKKTQNLLGKDDNSRALFSVVPHSCLQASEVTTPQLSYFPSSKT